MFKEFRNFIAKGNVIDMAVGVIIGGAFGKIVSSLVADIFMPVLGLFTKEANFSEMSATLRPEVLDAEGNVVTEAVLLKYGVFIQNIIDFLLIAIVIFLMIKVIAAVSKKAEALRKKNEQEAPAPVEEKEPEPTKEELLLTEIRDLLKEKN